MSLKSDSSKLIQAYALKLFSERLNAPLKTQQRLHDAFQKLYDRLLEKYGDQADMQSRTFWDQLQAYATKWWKERPMRGPGVDW